MLLWDLGVSMATAAHWLPMVSVCLCTSAFMFLYDEYVSTQTLCCRSNYKSTPYVIFSLSVSLCVCVSFRANIIDYWEGSLNAQTPGAKPLKNIPCNSSDLLSQCDSFPLPRVAFHLPSITHLPFFQMGRTALFCWVLCTHLKSISSSFFLSNFLLSVFAFFLFFFLPLSFHLPLRTSRLTLFQAHVWWYSFCHGVNTSQRQKCEVRVYRELQLTRIGLPMPRGDELCCL